MRRKKAWIPKPNPEPEQVKMVRVVREAGGLGDILRVLAVCQGAKKIYPNAKVHLYGPFCEALLISERSNHCIDLYISCEYQSRDRDILIEKGKFSHLDHIDYDVTIDGWCPPYLHEPATNGLVNIDRTELWCRAGGVPFSRPYLEPTEQDFAFRDTFKKFHPGVIVGIQPGATCRSREWPYRYWNEIARLLHGLGVTVVLFDVCWRAVGSSAIEQKYIVPSISENWVSTVGKLLACDLVITPDSGFYHLAGMLRKKCLGIFGCTNGEVISRVWSMEQKTGYHCQLSIDELDYSKLHKGCNPRCYMQWSRGWNGDRYRKEGKYCSLMEQLLPEMVWGKIKHLINF